MNMTKAGRPRVNSKSAITSPLSEFLDANWNKAGLTNDAAANEFGFRAVNLVSMWRTGRTAVPIAHLQKIAQLLKVDVTTLFVLWLRQLRLRNDAVPPTLVETLERHLMTANEAEIIRALRHATKNADPAYSRTRLAAIVREALR